MKRLLLLLFIPTLSYSQMGFLSHDDLMGINSQETFKRVLIENGYEFYSKTDTLINYGYDITSYNREKFSDHWVSYNKITGGFVVSYELKPLQSIYDYMVSTIKKKCVYYDITQVNEHDFVCYFCSNSKYSGKIGYSVMNGMGTIIHFPKEE